MKTIKQTLTNRKFSSAAQTPERALRALLVSWAGMRACGISTFHPLTLLFFIAYLLLHARYQSWISLQSPSHLTLKTGGILAGFFSILMLLADYETLIGDLQSRLFQSVHLLICGIGFYLIGQMAVTAFLIRSGAWNLHSHKKAPSSGKAGWIWKRFSILSFCLTLLCWLPYLLANFPGIMTVDSLNQYGQITGELPLSNHHPWIHTMFMKACYQIGLMPGGDRILAIAFITLVQMLLCAGILAFMIATLQRLGARKAVLVICLLLFALLPYHGIYSVTLWKDILFSYVVLLFTTMLARFLLIKSQGRAAVFDCALYLLSALAMCLLRSNGWYAYLVCIPFLLLLLKRDLKKQLPLQLLIVCAVILIRGPLTLQLNIRQPDLVESLSLPIQMTARVYAEGEAVDEEDHAMWNRIMDTAKIPETYDPHCSDRMKNLIRLGDQEYLSAHRSDYGKLWLRFGQKHPGAYLRGYLDETKGYWYPGITNDTIGSDEGIGKNTYGLSARPLISGAFFIKLKEILFKLYAMVPIYGLLWSAGAGFWLFLLLAAKAISDGRKNLLLLFVPNAAVTLTLLAATPVYNEFRYAYPLMVTLPFLFSVMFLYKSPEGEEES